MEVVSGKKDVLPCGSWHPLWPFTERGFFRLGNERRPYTPVLDSGSSRMIDSMLVCEGTGLLYPASHSQHGSFEDFRYLFGTTHNFAALVMADESLPQT